MAQPRPWSARTAKFTPTHLTNLLLALGCGEPVKAVETVLLFRTMLVERPPIETRVTRPTNQLMPPEVSGRQTI